MAALGAVIVGVGVVNLVAAPAQAASATCDSSSTRAYDDGFEAGYPTLGLDSANTNCLLRLRNTGEGVALLQRTLAFCYHHPEVIPDGNFGPKTRAALIDAQAQAGVTWDGIYRPRTAAAMAFEADSPGGLEGFPPECRRL